jgi:hypothetical protein
MRTIKALACHIVFRSLPFLVIELLVVRCYNARAWLPYLGLFMNTCYAVRSSRQAGLFSFGLLDGLHVRLRRPYVREAPEGFGLERFATALIKNPG